MQCIESIESIIDWINKINKIDRTNKINKINRIDKFNRIAKLKSSQVNRKTFISYFLFSSKYIGETNTNFLFLYICIYWKAKNLF